ncbi:T9SS type A sorting domain-containing protein [Polaribacter sp. Asnod6-C07]|uniref:T9SS type A sorting domain-containing protein n=1 Tax=Polaribacter sp. Asnod6-C07 TaxID=3160582 RepID=UPI003865268B
MKKTLLFFVTLISISLFAQDPVIYNDTFSEIPKAEGTSDCSCSFWINKDLGDQAETSNWNSSTIQGVKFDNAESDLIYQEVAVLANTEYKLTYRYRIGDPDDNSVESKIEFRILAGSGYKADYTPVYYDDATTKPTSGFGYETIADVENSANNLKVEEVIYPGDDDDYIAEFTFNSGDNTSIAILGRGIGRPNTPPSDASDSRPWQWSSGDQETRLDYIKLTNESDVDNGGSDDVVIQNATLDLVERDGQSDCSCAGWQNKDLGDQLESSSWNSSSSFGAKFDELESDIMYQEIAVSPNTNYEFTYLYNFEDKATGDPASSLDVRILAGANYTSGYSPSYPTPFAASSTGYGYTEITVTEDSNNNLASDVVTAPADTDFRTGTLTFNSGDNTSVAIFLRGIGRDVAPSDGKDYNWSNGSSEIRIDEVSISVVATASVDDFFNSELNVYPNPAKEFVTISTLEKIDHVEVFNLLGKQVIKTSKLNNNILDVSSLSKGVYLLKLTSGDSVATRKLIKN